MYFHDPVCVTRVDVWLTDMGGIPRAPATPATGLDTGDLALARFPHGARGLHRGGHVLLDVHRHLLANRRADGFEAHEAGLGGEGAEDRRVHDRLRLRAQPVTDGDAAG